MKDKSLRDVSLPIDIIKKYNLINMYEKSKETQMVIYVKCVIIDNQMKITLSKVVDLFN